MNNTEYELLSKEKLLEMYENALDTIEEHEEALISLSSILDDTEAEVEYWRDKYESITRQL